MKSQYILINENGTELYYSDREMTILHREDGPAIKRKNGDNSWRLDGGKAWFLNGKYVFKSEFIRIMKFRKYKKFLFNFFKKYGIVK